MLLTSLSVKLLCTHVSSLKSTILLLSALVALAIFRTQLVYLLLLSFGHCQGFPAVQACWCHTSAHDLALLRSGGPPSPPQLLSTRSLRPVLFDVPLSPSSRLHILPLLDTQNCPPESVSSPPAWLMFSSIFSFTVFRIIDSNVLKRLE